MSTSTFIPNNYDAPGNWAPNQPQVLGRDNTNGGEIDPLMKNQGEEWYLRPRIRVLFFTDAQAAMWDGWLRRDLGPLYGGLVPDEAYEPAPNEPRKAYKAIVNGEKIGLGGIRDATAIGDDWYGNTIYSQDKYKLGMDQEVKFSYVPWPEPRPEGAPEGQLAYTPPLLPVQLPPLDLPPRPARPGHYWWKSVFGWVETQ